MRPGLLASPTPEKSLMLPRPVQSMLLLPAETEEASVPILHHVTYEMLCPLPCNLGLATLLGAFLRKEEYAAELHALGH